MKSVMLYFGSFNPIHKGHMAVAEYVVGRDLCDELWFVVSPQNPMKINSDLLDEHHRLEMVRLAVGDSKFAERIRACDVEFGLPRPSYTINTLDSLSGRYPNVDFSLLVGGDIASQIDRWKESERLLRDYRIFLYPRNGYGKRDDLEILADAPRWDFSSTEVRNALRDGGDVTEMLSPCVADYIHANSLY